MGGKIDHPDHRYIKRGCDDDDLSCIIELNHRIGKNGSLR
jgi:hypothetical protein